MYNNYTEMIMEQYVDYTSLLIDLQWEKNCFVLKLILKDYLHFKKERREHEYQQKIN